MDVKFLEGDIFSYINSGNFDAALHGCNTQSVQKAGIAVEFDKRFETSKFKMELSGPNINKLGCIDFNKFYYYNRIWTTKLPDTHIQPRRVYIVNCYTQLYPGRNTLPYHIPFDYDAFKICLRKINKIFQGKRIIMPWIGCGKAKADYGLVRGIILQESTDINTFVVTYNKQKEG